MKINRVISIVLSLALLMCFSACSASNPTAGTELVTSENGDFTALGACGMENANFANYLPNVFDTLLEYDNGEIKPLLAESWEMSGSEITLNLRKGVKFSDGRDFNAEVVKQNIEAMHKFEYDNISWFQIIGLLDHVEVVDEYTAKIVLTQPYYAALYELASTYALGMMSPAAFEMEGNPYRVVTPIAGTGPYMITDFKQGSYYTFERNENYWGEKPAVDKLTVKIMPDLDSRLAALRSGDIDFIVGISQLSYNAFDELKKAGDMTCLISEAHSKSNYISFNSDTPALQDIQVRQAIAEAIDKETLIDGVLYGLQDNAGYMFDPTLEFCGTDLPPYSYNPEHTKTLLDAAGWKADGSTGIREKDDKPLTLRLIYPAGYGSNEDLAQVMKAQLADVGIEIKLESYDFVNFNAKVFDGDYDLALNYTYGVPYDPQIAISGMLANGLDDVSMQSFDFKANLNATITELLKTSDPQEATKLVGQVVDTIHTNYAVIPFTYENELIVYRNDSISDIAFFGQPGLTVIKNITPAQ